MNFKVRLKNPVFIAQVLLAIMTPVLAYAGLTFQDMTSWKALGSLLFDAIKNPYVLAMVAVSIFNAINDPTTAGLKDSDQAMTYIKPKEGE